jgi:hypothetical protein
MGSTSIVARALLLAAITLESCDRQPNRVGLDVGRHHVRLVVPVGWEHLDHGREQLFRNGETELRLTDYGAATPAALADEVRNARALWKGGRTPDALARIRSLDAPILRVSPPMERADFWQPFTSRLHAGLGDDAALGEMFDAMIARADALPRVSADPLVSYVLEQTDPHAAGMEIEHRDSLAINGTSWVRLATWSRVSHMDPRRTAFAIENGGLLVLACERGPIERAGGAFDSLLASIEVLPKH